MIATPLDPVELVDLDYKPRVRAPALHAIDSSTLLVSWSAVPGASAYVVALSVGGVEAKYVDWPTGLLKTSCKDAHSGTETVVTVKGLQADVPYKAKVLAKQGNAWSSCSAFSPVIRLPGLVTPSPPSLQRVGPSALQVTWAAVPGASAYGVALKVEGDEIKYVDCPTGLLKSSWKDTHGGTETAVTIKGLEADVPYKAKVRAQQGGAWSSCSAYSPVIRLPELVTPSPPSLQLAGPSSLQVSWASVPGASAYGVALKVEGDEIKYVDCPTGLLKSSWNDAHSGNQTVVTIKGLEADMHYEAKVRAQQGGAWSSCSAYSPVMRLPGLVTPSPPSLQLVGPSSLQASWAVVPGASAYGVALKIEGDEIKYVDCPTGLLKSSWKDAQGGTETAVTIKGLEADVPYKAKVRAKQGDAWSSCSAYSPVIRLPKLVAPSPPSLQLAGPSSLQVSWAAVTGASAYKVALIDDRAGIKYVDWPTGLLTSSWRDAQDGTQTSITVKGLKADVPYRAKVIANHGDLWSSGSTLSAVMRLTFVAPSPPSLHIVDSSTLQVAWSAVPGASAYRVRMIDKEAVQIRYVDFPTGTLKINGAKAGESSVIIVKRLKADVPYEASVAARHGDAWSSYSDFSAEVRLPKLVAPSPPSLQIVDTLVLQVAWSVVPGASAYGVALNDGGAEDKYVDWPTGTLKIYEKDTSTGTKTTVTVKGLKADSALKARVAAKHGDVWSNYSAYSTVVKLHQLPQAPLLEAVNNSMFVVSWPQVPDASMYDIIIDDGKTKHVNWRTHLLQEGLDGTTAGSATSVIVKCVQNKIPYKAKVAAFVEGIWSQYSPWSPVLKLGTEKRSQEQNCAICLSKPVLMAIDPCGHLCACEQCAVSLARCPLCRGNVVKRLRIY